MIPEKLLASLRTVRQLRKLRNQQSEVLDELMEALVHKALGEDQHLKELTMWQEERAVAIVNEAWRKLQALK